MEYVEGKMMWDELVSAVEWDHGRVDPLQIFPQFGLIPRVEQCNFLEYRLQVLREL